MQFQGKRIICIFSNGWGVDLLISYLLYSACSFNESAVNQSSLKSIVTLSWRQEVADCTNIRIILGGDQIYERGMSVVVLE